MRARIGAALVAALALALAGGAWAQTLPKGRWTGYLMIGPDRLVVNYRVESDTQISMSTKSTTYPFSQIEVTDQSLRFVLAFAEGDQSCYLSTDSEGALVGRCGERIQLKMVPPPAAEEPGGEDKEKTEQQQEDQEEEPKKEDDKKKDGKKKDGKKKNGEKEEPR